MNALVLSCIIMLGSSSCCLPYETVIGSVSVSVLTLFLD